MKCLLSWAMTQRLVDADCRCGLASQSDPIIARTQKHRMLQYNVTGASRSRIAQDNKTVSWQKAMFTFPAVYGEYGIRPINSSRSEFLGRCPGHG